MATKRRNTRGKQGKKDSPSKRVNYDNAREDKFEKDTEKFSGGKKTNACNDVSWYAANAELLKSAASLPFSTTVGLPVPYQNTAAVPGILSSVYVPTIGPRVGGFDPINQAANSIYSFVVHANSRNQSYDAPDLMMVILAGAQLFSMIAHGIRAYGTMRLFDQQNKYLPRGLVTAMGFDYDDLKANLSHMWFDLNEMIARAGQIWIPNTMPVIERWYWMNSNIYMDASGAKAQYYMFVPGKAYKFSETAHPTGSSLVDAGWGPDTPNTWAAYKQVVNDMFDALLDSQDRGVMFGDILKAYGQDKLYYIPEIPSDYTVVPQFDTEVLTQIENSTAILVDQGDIEISSANTIVLQALATQREPNLTAGNFLPPKTVLNFHHPEPPTPEEVMVATRLQAIRSVCAGGTAGNANWQNYPSATGTEYVRNYYIWYFDGSGVLQSQRFGSTTNFANELRVTDEWVAFDWAPWKYRYDTAPTAANVMTELPQYAVGDYDNYTIVDYDTMLKMHTAAVYSEFGVPAM